MNPGKGEALMKIGSTVWLSRKSRSSRELTLTWELVRKGTGLMGTNSVTANLLIHEIFRRREIYGMKGYSGIRNKCIKTILLTH